jgi:hypothetical protein
MLCKQKLQKSKQEICKHGYKKISKSPKPTKRREKDDLEYPNSNEEKNKSTASKPSHDKNSKSPFFY